MANQMAPASFYILRDPIAYDDNKTFGKYRLGLPP
jgi:hypothetical protein